MAELFINTYGSAFKTIQPDCTGILFLASAESKATLHPNLMATHMFKQIINLKPPGKDERKEVRTSLSNIFSQYFLMSTYDSQMLVHLVQSHTSVSDLTEDPAQSLNYTALAMDTEGYLITDMKDLVSRAVHQAAIRVAEYEDEEGFKVGNTS